MVPRAYQKKLADYAPDNGQCPQKQTHLGASKGIVRLVYSIRHNIKLSNIAIL